MEIEEDKRDLISREISKFRDTHKVPVQPRPLNVPEARSDNPGL